MKKSYQVLAVLCLLVGVFGVFFYSFRIIERQKEEIEALKQQRDSMSRILLEQALDSFDAQQMEFTWRTFGGLPFMEKTSGEFLTEQLELVQDYIDGFRFKDLVSSEDFNSVETGVWAELEFDCPLGHVYTDLGRVYLITSDGQYHHAYFEINYRSYKALLNSLGIPTYV